MAADVSVEALEKVKESAQQFGESVAKISADIVSQNEAAMDDCKNAITDAKKDLEAVIKTIQALDQQIYAKASEISHANNEIANLKKQIASFQSKLEAIESRIAMLENQRAQLQAQLNNADNEDAKKQIQQQINEVERAISNCYAEESELRGRISTAKYQIEELQSKISSLKAEMAKLEQERDREKVRKDKIADKLERMSRSFSTLSADLNEYTNAVKKFESKSASNMDANVSAIDKCITAIESYLAVNLASGFVSSSGTFGGTSGGGTSGGGSGTETNGIFSSVSSALGNMFSSNSAGGSNPSNSGSENLPNGSDAHSGTFASECMSILSSLGIPNCSWVQNALSNVASSGQAQSASEVSQQIAEDFIRHSIVDANPNFNNGINWQINCQRCVPVCEMIRRGYNVIARPQSRTGHISRSQMREHENGVHITNTLSNSISTSDSPHSYRLSTRDGLYAPLDSRYIAQHPYEVWQNPDVINVPRNANPMNYISEQMSMWGEGSRAQIVVGYRRNATTTHVSGHTFYAEYRNGELHISDPQTGTLDRSGWINTFNSEGLLSSTSFCRIDNLEFSNRIEQCYIEV